MACGDITSPFLPACGLTALSIVKSSVPPNGSLILPGDLITWSFIIESSAEGPPGISFEDIFDDCTYLENLIVVTPGWNLTVDGGNPCRYIIDNPAAVNPGINVVVLTATVGDTSGPLPVGFGFMNNTANALTPFPAAGDFNGLTFGPLLVGDVPNQQLGAVVNYQYVITSGTAPFVVSLYLGALPPGLSIDANGLLTGTANTAGDFTFTLQLLDDNGNTYLLSDECIVSTLATLVNGEEEAVEALSISLTTIAMS